jgi:hypothetical protein
LIYKKPGGFSIDNKPSQNHKNMANTDNQCKDLLVENDYVKSTNHLEKLMNLQKNTQESVYGYDFKNLSLGEIKDFWLWNTRAIEDEISEAYDALGGVSNNGETSIGNAVWKPWKSNHKKAYSMKISDLSEGDLKELKMELVDIQHFLFNMMISVGMTAEELYNYYCSKNKENIRRQENNY